MSRKRRHEPSVPELPDDSCLSPVSWRTGEHCDVILQVGIITYSVHKVFTCCGSRASVFLNRACATEVGAGSKADARIDLTDLLPLQLHQLMETVLDFMYTGRIHIVETTIVKLFVLSDILQIRALHKECNDALAARKYPTVLGAPQILADCILSSEAIQDVFVPRAVDCIARNFLEYTADDLAIIPSSMLQPLLVRNDLCVMHEDQVYAILAALHERKGNTADFARLDLSQCCRIAHLSPRCLAVARDSGLFSKDTMLDALIKQDAQLRSSFQGISCFILADLLNDFHDYDNSDDYALLGFGHHLEARGCRVFCCTIDAFSAAAANEHTLLRNLKHSDVVLTNIDVCEVGPATNALKEFVDSGGALVIVRSSEEGADSESDEGLGLDYEPLLLDSTGRWNRRGTGEGRWNRKGKHRVCLQDSTLSCGVDLERSGGSWQYMSWHHRGFMRVANGAKVVVELCTDDDKRIPICALHSSKLIASIWDRFLGDFNLTHGRQLMMNLLLHFVRKLQSLKEQSN